MCLSKGCLVKNLLDENTLVPIGLALAVFGGGAAWLTKIALQTNANAATLNQIATKQDAYTEHLAVIRQDIAVIKSEIGSLKEEKKWNK